MGRTINTDDLHNVVTKRKDEYGKLAVAIADAIEDMVRETPTTDRTNQDFIDRCREYENGAYTGREIKNLPICYILRDCPEFGLKEGYCILGL